MILLSRSNFVLTKSDGLTVRLGFLRNKSKEIWRLSFMFITSFLAWNYFGLLFVITLVYFFDLLNKALTLSFFRFILKIYLVLLVLNISVTFWLFSVNITQAIFAQFISAFNMLVPLAFLYFSMKFAKSWLPFFFVLYWIIYEVLSTYWFLSWPWLTFGNAMSNNYYFVQWIAIFGIHSASGWLIILGFLLRRVLRTNSFEKKTRHLIHFGYLLLIPIIFSLVLYIFVPLNKEDPITISMYMPENIDISNLEKAKKLDYYLKYNSPGEFIVTPELFFESIQLSSAVVRSNDLYYLEKIVNKYPSSTVFLGAGLRNHDNMLFNTIIVYGVNNLYLRSKKRYIPIKEHTPIYFEGILGKSFYQMNINDNQKNIIDDFEVLPLVCYESLFSSFLLKNIGDARIVFLLTSEQFMNGSFYGIKQYMNIIRLRAIESNRNIVKCSSGGISAIINEKGAVYENVDREFHNVRAFKIEQKSLYNKMIDIYEKVF